ncbi:MAG: extracellular solute-binding protein [Actinomycetota bacterium]|nr:extracellular solute-binding protein [Actinomycetota bacterium]
MTPLASLRSKLVLVLLALVASTGLAACGGGPGGDEGETQAREGGAEIQTDPSRLGDVTLTVWDQEVRGGQNQAMKALNAAFEKEYPNIAIKRQAKSFTDLQTTLKLAASGPNPPDVVQANNGYSAMGPLVKANLLAPLDEYRDAYAWGDRWSAGILKMNQFTEDGAEFGRGNLYGVPTTGEVVGVFYNKAKLRQLDIPFPETFDDFEVALESAKAGGETPIQFGNLDKWPGIHEYEELQIQHVDKEYARSFIFGEGEQSFSESGNGEAASQLVEWARNGYFTKGFQGLGYDPSYQQFGKGQGVFLITGSWLTADLKKALGDDLGFMLLPPPSGGSLAAVGGEGLPWAISSKSKNADAAAAYIDFITSDEAAQVITDAGLLSATTADVTVPEGIESEVFDAWKRANDEEAIVPYLDWATPTMYDTITAGVQKLMGGQSSPDEFVAAIQADYEKFHQGGS